MEIGYTVWTWLSQEHKNWERVDDPKAAFEQALREISSLGYQTVENFNWFSEHYQENPQEVVALCSQYNLRFVNLYHYLTNDFELDIQKTYEYCKFAQAIGLKYMNLQMFTWQDAPFYRPTDYGKIEECARRATLIGKIAKEHGITLCVHPHAKTSVFTMEQIEIFTKLTDPDIVSLCLDTAHITLSGGNPVEVFEKFIDRVAYVHFKDIDPDTSAHPECPMKRFCALGQGTVDFKGVYHVLQSNGYDGIICVELDYQKVCNYQSAEYSRLYLKNLLNM